MKSLKDIFSKKSIIKESIRLSNDSVDSQIDSVLLGYKQDSLAEGKLDRFFSRLLEAPEDDLLGGEDEDLDSGSEEDPDAPPPDQTAGDDELDAEEPAPTKIPKINIDSFAQKVVGLHNNFQSLLNIESAIIQRAIKVITEAGYNQATISEFKNILANEFGIQIDRDGFASDSEQIPAVPAGIGAGPEVG